MKKKVILALGISIAVVLLISSLLRTKGGSEVAIAHKHIHFSTPNLAPQIAKLEESMAGKGSAAEKAMLAGLYVKQAKLTGDATWYDKAEAMAKSSLAAQPTSNPAAKLALAETLEKRHLFAQSLVIAREVLRDNPRNPEALAAFATVSLAVGDIDEASRAVDLAMRLHPVSPILTLRALVLMARGRDSEAEFSFRRSLAVEDVNDAPEAANTRSVYARFLLTKGRTDQARQLVNEALQIIPGQHLALSISGDLHLKNKSAQKAAKDFSEAFAASPQVSYLRKFSKAKRMLRDDRGADDAMREALALARKEIASGVHAHPLELSYVLIASPDPAGWNEAIRLATDELNVRRSVLPYIVLAQANEKAGNWEAATEAIDAVLRTGVRNPDYFLSAARIAKGAGDNQRARFYFEAALKEDAGLVEAEEGIRKLAE